MLGFIVFILKVIIGGVISYILPSLSKKDLSHQDHLKISSIGLFSSSIFSVCIQMGPESSYMLSTGGMILIGFFSYNLSIYTLEDTRDRNFNWLTPFIFNKKRQKYI